MRHVRKQNCIFLQSKILSTLPYWSGRYKLNLEVMKSCYVITRKMGCMTLLNNYVRKINFEWISSLIVRNLLIYKVKVNTLSGFVSCHQRFWKYMLLCPILDMSLFGSLYSQFRKSIFMRSLQNFSALWWYSG